MNFLKIKIKEKKFDEALKNRTYRFKQFSLDFLNEKSFEKNNEPDYEYFIVGSDQVWNPYYIKNQDYYFLTFTNSEKKLSYAASFGISDLNEKISKEYSVLLKDFKDISVRETKGADIIEDILEIRPQVVLDPTLLLDKNDWKKISNRAENRPQKKYLLTYFLGEIDKKNKKIIDTLVKLNDYDVINLGLIDEVDTYSTSPREFLDYIENASLFLTDSFHGTVFSIIFETNFITFPRGKMNSRIDTLLETFKLEDRKSSKIYNWHDLKDINFTITNAILKEERTKSIEFLKKNLMS